MTHAASSGARRIPRLLSVRAVAEATTLPASTVYTLIARGELAAVRIGRAVRVREDDLVAFIEARREVAQ